MNRNLLTAMLFLFLLYSCGSAKTALDYSTKDNGQFPPNFNPAQLTLLIEQTVDEDKSSKDASVPLNKYVNYYMKKRKQSMTEYADKNYPYKHEYANQYDIYGSNSKYSDKKLYQFALIASIAVPTQSIKMSSNGTAQSTNYQPVFKFYIYDRLNNTHYAALGHGSSLIMWAFKAAIDKVKQGK